MTVTSGVIQLGCAAWVAETMSSQEPKGPFAGGARAGGDNGGCAF